MPSENLVAYIKQEIDKGYSVDRIRTILRAQGWPDPEIDAALKEVEGTSKASAPTALSYMTNGDDPHTAIPTHTTSSVTPPMHSDAKLPGAFSLLHEAWQMYVARFTTLIVTAFLPVFFLIASVSLGFFGSLLAFAFLPKSILGITIVGAVIICAVLALIFFQFWGQLALLYAVGDSDEKIGVKEAYRRSWHKVLSFGWLSILAGFLTLGGFLLFFIPGIIWIISFSMATWVLVMEDDAKGLTAILKSREYVRGRWWSVWWRLSVLGAAALLFYGVFSSILYKTPYLNGILNILVSPFFVTYSYLIYSHLHSLKGDIIPDPKSHARTWFSLVGILGFLVIPIALLLVFFLVIYGVFKNTNPNPLRFSFSNTVSEVRDLRRLGSVGIIHNLLQEYYQKNNAYPKTLSSITQLSDPSGRPFNYCVNEAGDRYMFQTTFENEVRLPLPTSTLDAPLLAGCNFTCDQTKREYCFGP